MNRTPSSGDPSPQTGYGYRGLRDVNGGGSTILLSNSRKYECDETHHENFVLTDMLEEGRGVKNVPRYDVLVRRLIPQA
jgi:hypothetical protein